MDNDEEPFEIKLILLGESGVGKTSIISRYVNDKFNESVGSSMSMCYVAKILNRKNMKIKLDIWDTIGQEKFRSLSKMFLTDTKIVILVYSIISKESFQNLNFWLNLYKDHLDEETVLGVAGNKNDLYLDEEVSEEEGIKYAEDNGAIFGLISAKQDKNSIDAFINKLVDAYLSKNKNQINNDNKIIKLTKSKVVNNNNSKSSCCSGGNSKTRRERYDSIVKNLNGCVNSVFLGNKGVGKTSIIKRIKGKDINKKESHTEENTTYSIDYNNKDVSIKLKIHDVNIDNIKTKEFIEIIQKSNIFFLVYDIRKKKSLNNLQFWIEVIKKCKDDEKMSNNLLYIIGNKDDLTQEENNKEIHNENKINVENKNKKYINEGKEFSNKHKGIFKVISAFDNKGIKSIVGDSIEHYLCLK